MCPDWILSCGYFAKMKVKRQASPRLIGEDWITTYVYSSNEEDFDMSNMERLAGLSVSIYLCASS